MKAAMIARLCRHIAGKIAAEEVAAAVARWREYKEK